MLFFHLLASGAEVEGRTDNFPGAQQPVHQTIDPVLPDRTHGENQRCEERVSRPGRAVGHCRGDVSRFCCSAG